jgi:hypothetical protein
VDEIPELAGRVRAGEIPVEPANGESPLAEPSGLIHDWVGAVFIPKARLDHVMGVFDDYAHYQDIYDSMVAKSKLLDGAQDRERVSLVMVQKAYEVTASVETDNDVTIVRPSADRAYSFSASVRVQEIADFGDSTEHALPVDQGHGYVWRMFTISRVEQRDDGVYVEMDLMGLNRSIPWVFRWLVQPLAERLPRAILRSILDDTRNAVNDKVKAPS